MKKFLIKLLLITAIFVAVDKVFLFVEDMAPELEFDRRLETTLEGDFNKEILIIGSSRSARSMIASDIEAETGKSTLNLAYHGTNLDFHKFILDIYLANNTKPELIILGVDDYESFIRRKTTFRADKLYSFTKYPEVKNELVERGEKMPYITDILVSHRVYRNSIFFKREYATDFNRLGPNGSMTIDGTLETFQNHEMSYEDREVNYIYGTESYLLIKKYKQFLDKCEENDIPVLIVAPPNYRPPSKGFRVMLDWLTGDQAEIYHYNDLNGVYSDKAIFYDAEHLNIDGAHIYTNELIEYLKENYE